MLSFKQNMENLTIQMDLNNIIMWRGLMFLLEKNLMLKKLPM